MNKKIAGPIVIFSVLIFISAIFFNSGRNTRIITESEKSYMEYKKDSEELEYYKRLNNRKINE